MLLESFNVNIITSFILVSLDLLLQQDPGVCTLGAAHGGEQGHRFI